MPTTTPTTPLSSNRLLCLLIAAAVPLAGAEPSLKSDIEYAKAGEISLLLDLYRPENAANQKTPVLLWVHGGAWRTGSKSPMPLHWLVDKGYAVASADYRLSPVAPFPAQIHDLKAAVRFLRAKAGEYDLDADRIAVAGASAGGHLAALLGVSGGVKELEGALGDHLDQSSSVRAIVDYYGPTNFMTILEQSTPHGLSVRVPAFDLLLRGQPKDVPGLAKLASPVNYVDRSDPPLLIFHGDQDPQVPINQSHELEGAYEMARASVIFHVIHGAAHGGAGFDGEIPRAMTIEFLEDALRPGL